MAHIHAFDALFYDLSKIGSLEMGVAPLFDVVDPQTLHDLYQLPYNSLKITVPSEGLDSKKMGELVNEWIKQEVLVPFGKPAIYPLFQDYVDPMTHERVLRKGFVASIEVKAWVEKEILRHERTIAHSLSERLEVLKETRLMSSPTHGLYVGDEETIEPLLDGAIEKNTLFEITDHQGVHNRLAYLEDEEELTTILSLMAEKSIILADGHHRYSASLDLMKFYGDQFIHHHLMYFTGLETDHARIYPTHRIVKHCPQFNTQAIKKWLLQHGAVISNDDLFKEYQRKEVAILAVIEGQTIEITWDTITSTAKLQEPFALSDWLHNFLFNGIFGMSDEDQLAKGAMIFESLWHRATSAIEEDDTKAVFFLKPLETSEVALAGSKQMTFPPKTTFFFPKLLTGLLFQRLDYAPSSTPA